MIVARTVLLLLLLLAPTAALTASVRSGSPRVHIGTAPFSLTFLTDQRLLLSSVKGAGAAGPAALSVRTPAGWVHATTVFAVAREDGGLRMAVQTNDPQGATFTLRVRPAGDGIIAVEATYAGSAAEVLGI